MRYWQNIWDGETWSSFWHGKKFWSTFSQHLLTNPNVKNFIVEKRRKSPKIEKTFFSKVWNSVSRDFSHGWWALKSCLRCWRTFLNHRWNFEKKSCNFFNLMIFQKIEIWGRYVWVCLQMWGKALKIWNFSNDLSSFKNFSSNRWPFWQFRKLKYTVIMS